MAVKAIPDGYHSITPYLIIKGADRAIDFYKVFGAAHAHGGAERYRRARGNRNRRLIHHVGGRVPGHGFS